MTIGFALLLNEDIFDFLPYTNWGPTVLKERTPVLNEFSKLIELRIKTPYFSLPSESFLPVSLLHIKLLFSGVSFLVVSSKRYVTGVSLNNTIDFS